MPTSDKQRRANQRNAKKSTGPRTAKGKAVVAGNAIKHGILSDKLLLPHEDPAEYDALLRQLTTSLAPVGTLEQMLVEKIATSLWRQQRLVHAETAHLYLQTRPEQLAKRVTHVLFGIGSRTSLDADDLHAPDQHVMRHLAAAIAEYDTLNEDALGDLSALEADAPVFYHACVALDETSDALLPRMTDLFDPDYPVTFEDEDAEALASYFRECGEWCKAQYRHLALSQQASELVEWVKAETPLQHDVIQQRLNRYQASLDNTLYKAMKELRATQQWRLQQTPIDEAEVIDEDDSK